MGDSSITVGDVEISHLYDLVADFPFPRTLDRAFPAVPAEAWEPYRREYPSLFGPGNVPRFHVGCYLIRARGRTILADTGVGPASLGMAKLFGAGGHLPDRLRSAGVLPADIDTVMFTHLHPDHVGWNLRQDGGRYRPTFPRARYVAHRADWDTVRRAEVQQQLAAIAPGYVGQTLTPLASLGVLDLADGDCVLSREVTALHTPGDTPGSMSLLIASRGERAILVGDAIGHPAQVEHPDWGVIDDMDGRAGREDPPPAPGPGRGGGPGVLGQPLPGAVLRARGVPGGPALLAGASGAGSNRTWCRPDARTAVTTAAGRHTPHPRHYLPPLAEKASQRACVQMSMTGTTGK
jgi:glyoxylase-like metal-dependent hydrolase (beta-lactamase superfamily II)